MKIEQIYTGCLAQGAYYIESEGEAVVIDPLREVQPYINKAENSGAKIRYVFETHFHADFVSGHLDLAKSTGATIVYGPCARTAFSSYTAKDGEIFKVGKLTFQLLHTPGHTLESSCYLLKDESGKDIAIFTGDTLFIGDVGRPDLAQKTANGITKEYLAGLLYESLQNKIMPLADDIIVYPAHGAGSACGKNMSKETSDTLGHQKQTNYALQRGKSKEAFVKEVTEGLHAPPAYFPINVEMNRNGYDSILDVLARGAQAFSVSQFEHELNDKEALLLDTRSAQTFAKGFIPGSINIGLDGSFAPWVGALIPYKKQAILFIADEGREEEVVTRLARIGYDYAIGHLKGGFATWKDAGKQVDSIESISADELNERLNDSPLKIIDVRKEAEFVRGHLHGATNLPLDDVNEKLNLLNKTEQYYVHCAAGYRSMIFASILKARGYRNLVDIDGGFNAMKHSCEDMIELMA